MFAGLLNPSDAAYVFDAAAPSLRNFYREERENDTEFDINEIKSDILINTGNSFLVACFICCDYSTTLLYLEIDKKKRTYSLFISIIHSFYFS
jgi:hypothetical protein